MEFGLSLGSNLGDRTAHLRTARERILATRDATLVAASSLYETEPVGVQEKYRDMKFVNSVLIIESDESAEDWLPWLEEQVDGSLIVPHPRWTQRRFVIEPLAEVRGELILPNQHQTVAELLATLDDAPLVKLDVDWRSDREVSEQSGVRGIAVVCPSCHESFEVPSPALAEVPCDIDYDCEVCCRPMRVALTEDDGEILGQAYSIED